VYLFIRSYGSPRQVRQLPRSSLFPFFLRLTLTLLRLLARSEGSVNFYRACLPGTEGRPDKRSILRILRPTAEKKKQDESRLLRKRNENANSFAPFDSGSLGRTRVENAREDRQRDAADGLR